MIKEAINRILELSLPNEIKTDIGTFVDKEMHRLNEELRAEPLKTNTLQSIVDYIKNDVDFCTERNNIIHVVSPTEVRLYHSLDADRKRECVLIATIDGQSFRTGQYYDLEGFIINLQANFVRSANIDKLLAFVASVNTDSGVSQEDDGYTQKVTVKKGISLVGKESVPNPIALAPYRTFADVKQPESNFVFRLRDMNGVGAALFEADGHAWKLQAIENIAKYFHDESIGAVVLA